VTDIEAANVLYGDAAIIPEQALNLATKRSVIE